MMRLPFSLPRLALAMLAAAPIALLGGCISLAAKPPASLLVLNTAAPVPVDRASNSDTAATLTILLPSVPQALATQRVPVQTSANSIAYLKGALWAEPPSRLFARLLSDTVQARTGRLVLTPAQALSDPGARLSGELRNFTVDEAAKEAVVTYDATLVRGAGKPFEKRRFEARARLAAINPQSAAASLGKAANQVAAQVATWVGQ
ncbi:MAG: ABC-type transport auxiliary lipoprotein family protein [Sphingomonas sp.]|jgi:cholesterol transport system auxiliary component